MAADDAGDAPDLLHAIIGNDADTILWWQMVCRGVLIFIYTLLLVRVGGRRIFGKKTSFDIVMGVILGSIMGRALTGNARFVPTLVTATSLVALHWALAVAATRSRTFGHLIKGTEMRLVKDGHVLEDAMRKATLTEHDLHESLRSNGGTDDLEGVRAVYLERSGEISVIKDGA